MLQELEALYTLRARIASEVSAQRHLSRVLSRLTVDQLVARNGLPPAEAEALLEGTRASVRRHVERLRAYEDETRQTLERRGLEVDEAFNPYWGSSFAERHDTSRFGSQVEYYACIYTSRVSNFRFVSPSKYFISPHGSLPHWQVR
ncbi:MAG: HAD family hydrolase, partial [Myxococcales bacterium]|nr:HAD family hydrolase [Myxococcales bacterium]